ncbi:hypothetical protein [Streptomyces nanshensis]|uniref:Uncharacterized protein n=1 Tax=Streptomyces nanshensis TaxID=518642 RepID=A0A1E7LCC7_9ACTN|nr:hypothetical protein [Streptomyces nanshensis]OEV13623.1 hypothetical protein AN218_02655 [Streptomyces nanshensis]
MDLITVLDRTPFVDVQQLSNCADEFGVVAVTGRGQRRQVMDRDALRPVLECVLRTSDVQGFMTPSERETVLGVGADVSGMFGFALGQGEFLFLVPDPGSAWL